MKLFLDNKEHLQKLIDKFSHLSTAEEKMHLIELFLEDCCREITSDITWKCKCHDIERDSIHRGEKNLDASPEQLAMSQTSIERMVMAKIYTAALYPNGQIDVQRDQYATKRSTRMRISLLFFRIEFSVDIYEH